MGCKCQEAEGFDKKLIEAENKTTQTGIQHVVWIREINNPNSPWNGKKSVFVGAQEIANSRLKQKQICCYYMPDGKEVTKVPRKRKSESNK